MTNGHQSRVLRSRARPSASKTPKCVVEEIPHAMGMTALFVCLSYHLAGLFHSQLKIAGGSGGSGGDGEVGEVRF